MILGSSSGQLEGDLGRFATPFDTKKEPEQEPEVDKETCVEKYFMMWQFFSIINLLKKPEINDFALKPRWALFMCHPSDL